VADGGGGTSSGGAVDAGAAEDAAWAGREPWAAALLASDSGASATVRLARRAATLADLYREQYGAENVCLDGGVEGAGGFAVRVACDGLAAQVEWAGGGDTAGAVSVSLIGGAGGADEKAQRWLGALATTAALVDELALPARGAPAATVAVTDGNAAMV
jgi:hypothetical protein